MVLVLLALLLLGPLTGCSVVPKQPPADPQKQCTRPDKPATPYTDKAVAVFIIELSEVIDKCRALLGEGPTR